MSWRWLMAATLLPWIGCSSSSGLPTSDTSAVETGLADSTADHEAARKCFDDFEACVMAAPDAAGRDTCRAALQTCLPARPDRQGPPNGAHGDLCREHPEGPMPPPGGPLPPPPPDGPRPPHEGDEAGPLGPPPPRPEGGAGPGAPMHCGFGGPGADACKVKLDACLADTSKDRASCLMEGHACLHEAITANFQALCERHVARCRHCAPDQAACDKLAATCSAGVPMADQVSTVH